VWEVDFHRGCRMVSGLTHETEEAIDERGWTQVRNQSLGESGKYLNEERVCCCLVSICGLCEDLNRVVGQFDVR
jgi:hypothetical protein